MGSQHHSWMKPKCYRINQEIVVNRNEQFNFKNFLNKGDLGVSDDNKVLRCNRNEKHVIIEQSYTSEGNVKLNISMLDKSEIKPKDFADTVKNIFVGKNALNRKIISCRPFKPESSKSKTDLESGHFNRFANYVEDPDIRKGMKFGEALISFLGSAFSIPGYLQEGKETKEIKKSFDKEFVAQPSSSSSSSSGPGLNM